MGVKSNASTAVKSVLNGWQELSTEEIDSAFNNMKHVGVEAALAKTAAWATASADLRSKQAEQNLNIPYGPAERNKWDIFPSEANLSAPCLVYIHGGYWQRGSKEGYSCMVQGALSHGWSAALPGYTLAPDATLTQIVNELKQALDILPQLLQARGIKGSVVLSGWSAGGHLTTLLLNHPSVAAGVSISGVYNLYPLRACPHVNDKVKLSEEECATLSPALLPRTVNKPLHIVYGTSELPAFAESAYKFHELRSNAHLPGSLVPVIDANHFNVLEQLIDSNSQLMKTLIHTTLPHELLPK